MIKRPLLRAKEGRKVTYDAGTSNAQTVTLPKEISYLEIALNKVGWWLSEKGNVVEQRGITTKVGEGVDERGNRWVSYETTYPNGYYTGRGFYMSIQGAKRLRWIWNGKSRYSLFWGSRTYSDKILSITKDTGDIRWSK